MENECVYCPASKWNCYAIFYVIIHASTVFRALPYTDTKSRHAELALVSLQKRLAGPYKLQEFCRANIVGQMRERALSGVSELRLPLLLQKYLRYEDLITELSLICICPKLKPTSDPCICQLVKAGWHRCIWWRHQMETFSALLALCAGNSSVTSEFPAQRPVTGSFDVFFDLRLE